jgi:hypothetical protein
MYSLAHVILPPNFGDRDLQMQLRFAASNKKRIADAEIFFAGPVPHLLIFTTDEPDQPQAFYDAAVVAQNGGFSDAVIQKQVALATSGGSRLVMVTMVNGPVPRLVIVTERT